MPFETVQHHPIVRALRRASWIGVAAIATLALTTVVSFIANRREDHAVLAVRDHARVAREAYVFAVERDDLLRGLLIRPDSMGLVHETVLRDSLNGKLDTLVRVVPPGSREDSLIRVARVSLQNWERMFVAPVLAGRTPLAEADLVFFSRVRLAFAELGATFSARYNAAVRSGDDLRMLSMLLILLQLLLILAGIRRAHRRLSHSAARVVESQYEIACRLGEAAEFRDDQTGQHSERVGVVAARIARTLGWDEHQTALMRRAAPLHDVGKIGVPDDILCKRGSLTTAEFDVMQSHTTIGARILEHGQSEIIRMAETIALEHHEHWDGAGYPLGTRGAAIPLAARIVAVADVFDALTHDRPYHGAWSVDAALAEIRRLRGTHLDPAAVDAFLRGRCYEETPRA